MCPDIHLPKELPHSSYWQRNSGYDQDQSSEPKKEQIANSQETPPAFDRVGKTVRLLPREV